MRPKIIAFVVLLGVLAQGCTTAELKKEDTSRLGLGSDPSIDDLYVLLQRPGPLYKCSTEEWVANLQAFKNVFDQKCSSLLLTTTESKTCSTRHRIKGMIRKAYENRDFERKKFKEAFKQLHGNSPTSLEISKFSDCELKNQTYELRNKLAQKREYEAEESETAVLKKICGDEATIRFAKNEIAKEKRIGKISGTINLTRLNEWGRTIVLVKDSLAQNKKKFRKNFRKKPDLSQCKKLLE